MAIKGIIMATWNIKNFSLLDAKNTAITVTVTTQRLELPIVDADDIMIINTSASKTVYARTGGDDVVADLDAMPILPGEKGVYSKGLSGGRTTHLALISESGSPIAYIVQGSGA